jgi:hypothetical protein
MSFFYQSVIQTVLVQTVLHRFRDVPKIVLINPCPGNPYIQVFHPNC